MSEIKNCTLRVEARQIHSLGKLVRRTCRYLGIEVASPAHAATNNDYIHSLMVLTRRIQRCVRNQSSCTDGSSMQNDGPDTAVKEFLQEDRQTALARPEVTATLDRRLEQTEVMRSLSKPGRVKPGVTIAQHERAYRLVLFGGFTADEYLMKVSGEIRKQHLLGDHLCSAATSRIEEQRVELPQPTDMFKALIDAKKQLVHEVDLGLFTLPVNTLALQKEVRLLYYTFSKSDEYNMELYPNLIKDNL